MNRSSDRPTGAKCPVCGTWGAKKSLFSVKCVNPSCRKYDAGYAREFQQNRIVGRSAAEVFHLEGNEHYSLDIRYINFRGDELTYSADPSSGYIKKAHLVIRVAPRGRRISFRLSGIQNRSEVESQLPKGPFPDARERRVLNYHLRKGTTSHLFSQLREKYPDYHA